LEIHQKGDNPDEKISRFVTWICSKFTCRVKQIIQSLLDILANRNPDIKRKDDF